MAAESFIRMYRGGKLVSAQFKLSLQASHILAFF